MNTYFFNRDDGSAVKANSSGRMTAHEFYPAKITQAYWGVSQNDSKYLAVNLITANKETVDELKIYFTNRDGEKLSGYHQINAILAFNNIAGLSQVQGVYKSYDFERGETVDKQGLIAPELIGAYVGVILSENYYNGQNGMKYTLSLSAVYHVKTGQNAKQFLSNTPAVQGQIEQSIAYAQRSSERSRMQAENEAQNQGGQAWDGNSNQMQSQYLGDQSMQQIQNNHQATPLQRGSYPQGLTPSPSTAMQRPPSKGSWGGNEQGQTQGKVVTPPSNMADDDMPF